MGRTRAGIMAVLLGTIAAACGQAQGEAPGQAPAPESAASADQQTYAGCVRRMLGEVNFRLVDAVDVKAGASATPTALRLITAKGRESDLFDYIGHRVEVTGKVGDPLPVNNAMDDVNHLAITNIKNISDRCS
jgi:hypothetical protein